MHKIVFHKKCLGMGYALQKVVQNSRYTINIKYTHTKGNIYSFKKKLMKWEYMFEYGRGPLWLFIVVVDSITSICTCTCTFDHDCNPKDPLDI